MTVAQTVSTILQAVQKKGDRALCGYARRFDRVSLRPKDLRVAAGDFSEALKSVHPDFLDALRLCSAQIERFAMEEKKRLTSDWTVTIRGVRVGQQSRPVHSVGVYIPGGRFPYPSTVLMTVIPAKVAGVERIAIATPPKNLTPEVLAAAAVAGCRTVYRMGGAGAIAAFAYGTKTVEPVDFIAGPGNAFVTEAKRQVFGRVGIDSLAGPSEVVVIAERGTPLTWILQDLSAQAEHDPDSRSLLLTPDEVLLNAVRYHLDPALVKRVTLKRVKSLEDAADEANAQAPEHLELMVKNPEPLLKRIRHAGAIFLGPWTTAVFGDYSAGPSHVLPTGKAARFASGLSVATFLKRSSVTRFSGKKAEKPLWDAARVMAQTEGMPHHEASLQARL